MTELHRDVPRQSLRLLLILLFLAASIAVLLHVFKGYTPLDTVELLVGEKRIYTFLWIFLFVFFTWLLDFVVPKKSIVWIRVTPNEIIHYPYGSRFFTRHIDRSTISEIRSARKAFLGNTLFIFLNSGRYHSITEYDRLRFNQLAEFLKHNLPDININLTHS